ncbi:uncharacterized protein LOC108907606 [Anoplophora glabripennis]|uniref:uncharacterized protein LOC108907606 n=1 Tax=Anoplophora glabripennis TaxID=217634 RepID=UPI00087362E2|nr:uncharacterized protein LOC108907606 [Anoplophora glabripennis]
MKICVLIFLAVFFGTIWCSYLPKNIISVRQGEGIGGIWKSNVEWKAQWVKEWHIRKIYVPVWRKIWTPVDVREWIPIPSPPPPH